MKNNLRLTIRLLPRLLCASIMLSLSSTAHEIVLQECEIAAITAGAQVYAYFGPAVCSLTTDIPCIKQRMHEHGFSSATLDCVSDCIEQGDTTAPLALIDAALLEAITFLDAHKHLYDSQEWERLQRALHDYYEQCIEGSFDLGVVTLTDREHEDALYRARCAALCALNVQRKITAGCMNINCSAAIGRDVTVNGDAVDAHDLIVRGTIFGVDPSGDEPEENPLILIGSPQQACIIFLDESLNEKVRICSSPVAGVKGLFVSVDEGVTHNVTVNNEGGLAQASPSSGAALEVTGNALAPAMSATGSSTTTAPALQAVGNPVSAGADFLLTIDGSDMVTTSTIALNTLVINGCQAGPITFGTSDATTLTLATGAVCNSRITIDGAGAVTVLAPSTGEALTVNGNIIVPAATAGESTATAQGLVEFGGSNATASATNINMFEVATRNFFAGNYTAVPNLTGADNIGVGTSANSTLVLGTNNTLALGTSSRAVVDGVAIGDGANAGGVKSIVIGSADSSSTGVAPTSVQTGVVLGSASGVLAGASSSGAAISAISIGASDGVSSGASVSGARGIALGVNGTASATNAIAIGSSSTAAVGARALTANTLAVGSANGALAGASAAGQSAMAIGGSDSVFAGAQTTTAATNGRTIALGVGSLAGTANACIALGSASGTAGGNGARATSANTLAIGSGNGANRGALASAASALSVGSANAANVGALASDNNAIAFGVGATASNVGALAIGTLTSSVGVAIGSGSSALAGARAMVQSTIALGASDGVFAGPSITGSRAIGIGVGSSSSAPTSVCIGSASGTVGGAGPTATTGSGAILIGGGSGANAGPSSGTLALSSVVIGSANSSVVGASSTGTKGVALGVRTQVTGGSGVALGSGDTGNGAAVTAPTGVAVGSGFGALVGARTTTGTGIAIGSASGVVAGASSTALRGLGIGAGSLASQADAIALGTSSTASGGTNSVAIGLGATSSLASAIILGNSATTAVRVGIGTTDSIGVPSAKIHVVGVSGTPVLLMNQVATGITSAPQLLNPSTSAGAETPIHYDGSNELFGFTSSARYKENIRPIQRESDILYALRPVIYDAKEGHGVGTNIAGFIAEEVHEVAPHLAVLNRDRQPENIAYNSLHALAIKEIQKHDLMLQERAALVAAQDRAMHALLLSIEQLQAKLDALAFDEVQA